MGTKVQLRKPLEFRTKTTKRVLHPDNGKVHELTEDEMALWQIPGLIHAGDIVVYNEEEAAKPKVLEYKSMRVGMGQGGKPNIITPESLEEVAKPIPLSEENEKPKTKIKRQQ